MTERVRRRPYAVVLLDEIEKAHPDVFNILLQVLEEGRMTDSFGRRVDFKNTIIIMTSNIGAELLKKQTSVGFITEIAEKASYEDMKRKLLDEVKKNFKPEFLNRVDDIVVFHSLTKDDLYKIIDIEINEVRKRLKEQNIDITMDPEAKELLMEKGFDHVFGARPLKRTIQRLLEDPLAEEIIAGTFKAGSVVRAVRKGDGFVFEQ